MIAFMTLALALSVYLGWHFVAGGSVLGCGGGSPCDQVLNSRWSSIGGVLPVSGLAAGAYLAMLLASFYVGLKPDDAIRKLAWRALLILTGAAAGSAVWFIIVQKWFIGAFCPYCMTTHTIGLLLLGWVLWQAPKQRSAIAPEKRLIARKSALGWAMAGIGMAGVMAICQASIKPPPQYRGGESAQSLPAFDLHAAPRVGPTEATNIVYLLFDYKCPHCQRLHLMLNEAVRRYHGEVAFVLCPTPLNTQCNPFLPRDVAEFNGSCELVKTALAVWAAKPAAFAEFDRWMFSFDSGDLWKPRTLEDATAKAIELIGPKEFAAGLTAPGATNYLQAAIQIYGPTTQGANYAVPKLVYGSHWVIPQPNDIEDLMKILQESLGLPKP